MYLTLKGFVVESIKSGTGKSNPTGPYIILTIPYNRSDIFVIFLISVNFLHNSFLIDFVHVIFRMTNYSFYYFTYIILFPYYLWKFRILMEHFFLNKHKIYFFSGIELTYINSAEGIYLSIKILVVIELGLVSSCLFILFKRQDFSKFSHWFSCNSSINSFIRFFAEYDCPL